MRFLLVLAVLLLTSLSSAQPSLDPTRQYECSDCSRQCQDALNDDFKNKVLPLVEEFDKTNAECRAKCNKRFSEGSGDVTCRCLTGEKELKRQCNKLGSAWFVCAQRSWRPNGSDRWLIDHQRDCWPVACDRADDHTVGRDKICDEVNADECRVSLTCGTPPGITIAVFFFIGIFVLVSGVLAWRVMKRQRMRASIRRRDEVNMDLVRSARA
ncbi:MAG: hypothetical protein MHM6MM_001149 [Cercozoa sp. M6MM]